MNKFLVWLKENPAVIVQAVQALLAAAVAFNLVSFTDIQTGAVLAVVTALMGLITGLSVRPFSWALVTGLVQSAILLAAEFGFSLTENQIGSVMMVIAVLGMLLRQAVTPETKLPALAAPVG